ncbi:hypothetical protein Fcan01_01226 [Folsomia candida]|uniref:Uncharacterized protein n=1 Tax=Folsomia candida TaxID=158441 RepID=A0A226EW49_FOLCA|nr:hypothetical protein Fcan01_01226 [Folsomia candida]
MTKINIRINIYTEFEIGPNLSDAMRNLSISGGIVFSVFFVALVVCVGVISVKSCGRSRPKISLPGRKSASKSRYRRENNRRQIEDGESSNDDESSDGCVKDIKKSRMMQESARNIYTNGRNDFYNNVMHDNLHNGSRPHIYQEPSQQRQS